MASVKNILNMKFGRLLVLKFSQIQDGGAMWLCRCDCGNEKIVSSHNLLSGNTKSCGCLHTEILLQRMCSDNHPMKNPINIAKMKGSNNPLNRIDVKIIHKAALNSPEVKAKISGENSNLWKGGISFEPYCPKWNSGLRTRIRAFFNNTCIICGKTYNDTNENMCCHHVEYNKDACCDGKPVHFATLCRSCHARTNNNRLYWEYIIHRIIDEIYNGKSYYTKEEYYNMLLNG